MSRTYTARKQAFQTNTLTKRETNYILTYMNMCLWGEWQDAIAHLASDEWLEDSNDTGISCPVSKNAYLGEYFWS